VILSVRGLCSPPISDVSFDLHAGEILGVTGTTGSGQDTLAASLFGAIRSEDGEVLLDGRPFDHTSPSASTRAGLAYIPADRAAAGCVPSLSVRENVMLADLASVTRAHLIVSKRKELADLAPWAERLRLTPGSEERAISVLSGGNQQKAVMAKWLRRNPRVLLLDEPTHGVDVASKKTIFEMVGEAVAGGAAALVCSMNALELAETCDRVLVLRDGRIVTELSGRNLTSHAITEASYGRN
jgi:ribose transport system ATP-binding protein